jgi:hypothetical protein
MSSGFYFLPSALRSPSSNLPLSFPYKPLGTQQSQYQSKYPFFINQIAITFIIIHNGFDIFVFTVLPIALFVMASAFVRRYRVPAYKVTGGRLRFGGFRH